MKLETAGGTAKYANHANAEPDGDETRCARRLSALSPLNLFAFRVFGVFRGFNSRSLKP